MSTNAQGSDVGSVQIFFRGGQRIETATEACAKINLGRSNLPRESKWDDGWTLRCRDAWITAYAIICGPQDLVNGFINDVRDCAAVGAAAAGVATIIAGPAAALPAFKQAFDACLLAKIGNRINELSLKLTAEHESGDWGPC